MSRSRRRREQGHPAKIAARRERERNRSQASSVAAELCATAAGFSSPLDAELLVSQMLGFFWEERGLERPDDHELEAGAALVDDIADQGGLGAAILLATFGELAGAPLAARAIERAGSLAAEPLPDWAAAIGSARPERVAVMSESTFDDGRTYFIESVADDGSRHAVGVHVDNNLGRAANDILLADSIEKVQEVLAARPEDQQSLTITDVDPTEAAARVRAGLAITDRTLSPALEEDYAPYRALAWRRVGALPAAEPDETIPEVTEPDRAALHAEFLASPEAAGIEAGSDAADITSTAIDFAADHVDGRPLRWSPVVIELFMAEWLPREVVAADDDEYFAAVPDALTAWIRFTARKRELPDDALAETVEAVSVCKEYLAETRALRRAMATRPTSWRPPFARRISTPATSRPSRPSSPAGTRAARWVSRRCVYAVERPRYVPRERRTRCDPKTSSTSSSCEIPRPARSRSSGSGPITTPRRPRTPKPSERMPTMVWTSCC